MNTNLNVEDLATLLTYGASLTIDGSKYSPDDIRTLASYAKNNKVQLHIVNAGSIPTERLTDIATYGRANDFNAVHFDFSGSTPTGNTGQLAFGTLE